MAALGERHARELQGALDTPGRAYGAARAREVLSLAASIDEPGLTNGLQIGEADLKRAAVERYGQVADVSRHREHIDAERRDARAWQALLLLALGTHGTRSANALLVRWAADADVDLALAARIALGMAGDPDALETVRAKARSRGSEHLVDSQPSDPGAQAAIDGRSPPRTPAPSAR